MLQTKAFRNGNSQAVRIPAEIAFSSLDIDLLIERIGDEIRIRPAPKRISNVMQKLKAFSPNFMANGRELVYQDERESF